MPKSDWDWRLLRTWRICGSFYTIIIKKNNSGTLRGADAYALPHKRQIVISTQLLKESFDEFIDALTHEIDHAIDEAICADHIYEILRMTNDKKIINELEELLHDLRARARRSVMADNEGAYRYIFSKLNKKP